MLYKLKGYSDKVFTDSITRRITQISFSKVNKLTN